jgi:hypothetical protein
MLQMVVGERNEPDARGLQRRLSHGGMLVSDCSAVQATFLNPVQAGRRDRVQAVVLTYKCGFMAYGPCADLLAG